MISISDTDIDKAQSLLLRGKGIFDSERRKVIQDLEGFDVQASPGSGKTTTLLAKLLLISEQLPLSKNRGICVLTHTNVAINEIKDNLGTHFSSLFSYPNYFGTFQTFVHKYLANEIIKKKFEIQPKIVDDKYFNSTLASRLSNISWNHESKLRNFIYGLKKQRDISTSELSAILYYNFDTKGFYLQGRENPVLADPDNSKYPVLKKIFFDIYRLGTFRYADPYYLSLKYIGQFKSIYQNLLSNRFKYVFVDEMQDTDLKQCNLLNALFDGNKTILQRFGDINQSIFQGSVTEKVFWNINERKLAITGSKRFSQKIADKLIPLSVHNFEVIGTDITPEIQPHIIIFDDNNIKLVKDKFIELIKKHNLEAINNKSNNSFKAIGWVKDHDTYHGISSYWPDVVLDSSTSQRIFYDNIYSYVKSLKIPSKTKSVDANSIRKVLLNCLVQFSRELDQKNKNGRYFNPRSLLKHVSTINKTLYGELLSKLTLYCKKVVLQQDKVDELRKMVTWLFLKIFDLKKGEIENHDFVIGDNLDERVEKAGLEDGNIYNNDGVELEFSTIHGIKGETQTATLYLETFHNGYDLHRLKKELTTNNYTKPKKDLKIKSRKMAYVAMSRPTHFLCLAMHKNTLGKRKKPIKLSNQFIKNLVAFQV